MRFLKEPVSGLSHLGGLACAAVGAAWLLWHERHDATMLLASAAYALTMIALYAASAAYHLLDGSDRLTRRLQRLDHVAIFLFVAGTCTPVFLRGLHGASRVVMLAAVWMVALVGVVMTLSWRGAPRWLTTALYVGMGWFAVARWSEIVRALPPAAWSCVVAGGIVYTAGALVYAVKRPDPFPGRFGFHEIWHLFVLGGSGLHFAAVALL